MHTLFFDSHTAILDPSTGMGVLVLPDPGNECKGPYAYADQPASFAARFWFGSNTLEYETIITKLAGIDWELPRNGRGRFSWFDAGSTDCCGKSMIVLHAAEPENLDPSINTLVAVSQQIQDMAAWTCCGMDALTSAGPQLSVQPRGAE